MKGPAFREASDAKSKYSLIVEATDDPNFFGFYSPDLEGCSGAGESIEDCRVKAELAMNEHIEILRQEGLPVPPSNPSATVTVVPTT